jgi:undecaprenyl phosphate-alpha-L-ara4FN deformylase
VCRWFNSALGHHDFARSAGWKAQGYELVSLSSFRRALDGSKLPRHEVVFGQVAGRSGTLALQGGRF